MNNKAKRLSALKRYDFDRRQEASNLYRVNSAIYILDPLRHSLQHVCHSPDPFLSYEMSDIDSINVDSHDDLSYARLIAASQCK